MENHHKQNTRLLSAIAAMAGGPEPFTARRNSCPQGVRSRIPKRGAIRGFTSINGVAVDPGTEFCIDKTSDGRLYYRGAHNEMRRIKRYTMAEGVAIEEAA